MDKLVFERTRLHSEDKCILPGQPKCYPIGKNGRSSCGDRSRHINIRYFFIKDTVERENITVTHCPTEQMISDFFTKPLQGNLFRIMRNIIIGASLLRDSSRILEMRRVWLIQSLLVQANSSLGLDPRGLSNAP